MGHKDVCQVPIKANDVHATLDNQRDGLQRFGWSWARHPKGGMWAELGSAPVRIGFVGGAGLSASQNLVGATGVCKLVMFWGRGTQPSLF